MLKQNWAWITISLQQFCKYETEISMKIRQNWLRMVSWKLNVQTCGKGKIHISEQAKRRWNWMLLVAEIITVSDSGWNRFDGIE